MTNEAIKAVLNAKKLSEDIENEVWMSESGLESELILGDQKILRMKYG